MNFFEPVDHDPFAGSTDTPSTTPVDHDPFAGEAAAAEAPVTAGGLYQAVDAGAANAAASLAAMPRAIGTLGAKGIQAAANYVGGKFGVTPDTRDLNKPGLIDLPDEERARAAIQNDLYGNAPIYEPQNRAERYARTGGEFLLNAAMPGGAVSRAAGVIAPAVATEAVKEQGGGALAQAGAGLLGGAAGAKIGNIAERLGSTAVPSIEKGVAGNLRKVANGQYRAIERVAQAVPTTAKDRSTIADAIENHLHGQNFRRANADETYKILDEIRIGNPGHSSDFADLLNARRKLGNISGEDGKAAQQARDIVAKVIDLKVPGAATKLAEADGNWNAFKVADMLNAKNVKAADQTGATHSGLNLGNKLRQSAAEIANNPNRTKYMKQDDIEALRALAGGTTTQNAARYFGNYLGGGGGLGALIATGAGAGYYADHPAEGGAAALLGGLALKRGYNRSISNAALGIGQNVLVRSPQAGILGSRYVPPLTIGGALGRGIPAGILGYNN